MFKTYIVMVYCGHMFILVFFLHYSCVHAFGMKFHGKKKNPKILNYTVWTSDSAHEEGPRLGLGLALPHRLGLGLELALALPHRLGSRLELYNLKAMDDSSSS